MRPDRTNLLLGLDALEAALHRAQSGAVKIALDLETSGLELFTSEITWLSWCMGDQFGAVPIAHRKSPELNADPNDVIRLLQILHANPSNVVIWHNAGFDLSLLVSKSWLKLDDISAVIFDTMVASQVLNPVKSRDFGKGSHSLKRLFNEYLREENEEAQPTFDSVCNGLDFADVSINEAAWYAAFDAWSAYHLQIELERLIDKDARLKHYFDNIERHHLLTTVEIRTSGMRLVPQEKIATSKYLPSISAIEAELGENMRKVYDFVGRTFNLARADKMRQAIFDSDLNIEPQGRSDVSGRYLMDRVALVKMFINQDEDSNGRLALACLIYAKQLSETLKKHIEMYQNLNRKTGRVHPELFNVATGRYSASAPNILSLSSSSRIKEYIVPDSGNCFVVGDFSQIDLRVIANETGELLEGNSKMLRAVQSGVDLHLNTLKIVWDKAHGKKWLKRDKANHDIINEDGTRENLSKAEYDRIDNARSDVAKPVNFGISYGLGAQSLMNNLNNSDDFKRAILMGPEKGIEKMTDSDRKEWASTLETSINKKSHSLSEVQGYLEAFHSEYPEISMYQASVEEDLNCSGFSYNLFGRRSRIEIFPNLKSENVEIDVELPNHKWYRLSGLSFKMDRHHLHYLIHQIDILDVKVPETKKSNIRLTDLERKVDHTVYRIERDRLDRYWLDFNTHQNHGQLADELRGLHYESCIDEDDIFEVLESAVPTPHHGEVKFDQFLSPPNFPYLKLKHNFIRVIRFIDADAEVAYLGHDKLRRNLISARIQSTSMDFCKIAMIEFRNRAKLKWPGEVRPRIVNCVHDEIAVECSQTIQDDVVKLLTECMEDMQAFNRYKFLDRTLMVTISAEVKAGPTYGEAKG